MPSLDRSLIIAFGASMMSCLVRPLTFYLLCLPSGPGIAEDAAPAIPAVPW
jgi:hypothetical protein